MSPSFASFVLLALLQQPASDPSSLDGIRAYLKISDQLSTGGQIQYSEIPLLKEAGFEVVVNLAPARKERNGEEGYLVTEQGMTYIQIPVDWQTPSPRDLQLFYDVMKANRDRRVFVHCFANMRVSAFVYLYRTQVEETEEASALADLHKIWNPDSQEQWKKFIEAAKAAGR